MLATISRTACLGSCPVYSVSVDAEGKVVYDGEANVTVTGRQHAALTVEQLHRLEALFERKRFQTLLDRPRRDEHRTDAATVVITFRGKTLHHYLGNPSAPKELLELERELEQLLGVERWVGSGACRIPIVESVYFCVGMAEVAEAYEPVLDTIFRVLDSSKGSQWTLRAHAGLGETSEGEAGARRLALQRAERVLEFFVARGMPRERFHLDALVSGARDPVPPESRRMEFIEVCR